MPVRGKTAGNGGNGSKWINPKRRLALYERDGFRCLWCGSKVHAKSVPHDAHPDQLATLDHVVPRSRGGTHADKNLITSCVGCNRKRADKDALVFAIEDCSSDALPRVVKAIRASTV